MILFCCYCDSDVWADGPHLIKLKKKPTITFLNLTRQMVTKSDCYSVVTLSNNLQKKNFSGYSWMKVYFEEHVLL